MVGYLFVDDYIPNKKEEVDTELKNALKATIRRRSMGKKELSECTGIFKGGRRKELQQIDGLEVQI